MQNRFFAGHSEGGSLLTRLVHESFHLHGALLSAGDRLTKDIGLTSARWQVLGALALAVRPEPVAYIARNMGRARQSVQRVADELEQEGFLRFEPNPHHRRAPVLTLTEKGRRAFEVAMKRQVPWVNALAKGISAEHLKTALKVLQTLRQRLESTELLPRRTRDKDATMR